MYDHRSRYNHLRVSENHGVRLLRFDRNRQSSMLVADPFETDFEYPGYLHLTMAIQPRARRTLVLGLGGGSVVKRMWRDYPDMLIDTVEIDPEVVEVARTYFALPDDPRIEVIVEDGRAFLEATKRRYDIIVVDAFDDDRIPLPLLTEEFMRTARDHLAPGGVVAWNVIGWVYGSRSKPFRSIYKTASNVWSGLWVFPIGLAKDPSDRTHNIVMLATDERVTAAEMQHRIASRVGGLVTVPHFETFAEDLYTGPLRTGDVPLLLDAKPGRRHLR